MPRRKRKRKEQEVPKEEERVSSNAQEPSSPSANSGPPVEDVVASPVAEAAPPEKPAESPVVQQGETPEPSAHPESEQVPPEEAPSPTTSTAPQAEPVPVVESEAREAEVEPQKEPQREVPPSIAPVHGQPSGPSPWPAALLSGLLAFVFAVVVTLGVLSALNRGLLYARPADVGRLAARVQEMESQLIQIQGQVATLQQEVEALSDLGARVESLETQTQTLAQDVEAARTEIQALGDEVSRLQKQQQKVFSFFGELRQLLDFFFGVPSSSSEGAPGPEATPEATP